MKPSKRCILGLLAGALSAFVASDVMGYATWTVINNSGITLGNPGFAFYSGPNGTGTFLGSVGAFAGLASGNSGTHTYDGVDGQSVYPVALYQSGGANIILMTSGPEPVTPGSGTSFSYTITTMMMVTHYTNQACFTVNNTSSSPAYYQLASANCGSSSLNVFSGDQFSATVVGYGDATAISENTAQMLQVQPGTTATVCFNYVSTNNACIQACLLQGNQSVADCIPIGDTSVIVTGCVNGTAQALTAGQNAIVSACENATQWSSGNPTATNGTFGTTPTNIGTSFGTNGLPVPIQTNGIINGVPATNFLTEGTGLAGFETLNNDLVGINNSIVSGDNNIVAAINNESTNLSGKLTTLNTNLGGLLTGVSNAIGRLGTNSGGNVGVTNFPTNYPDSAAINELSFIQTNTASIAGALSNLVVETTNYAVGSNAAYSAWAAQQMTLSNSGFAAGTSLGSAISNLSFGPLAPTLASGTDGETISLPTPGDGFGGVLGTNALTISLAGMSSAAQGIWALLKQVIGWTICLGLFYTMMRDVEEWCMKVLFIPQAQGSRQAALGANASLLTGITYVAIITAAVATLPVVAVTYVTLYKGNVASTASAITTLSSNTMWPLVTAAFPIETAITAFFDYLAFRFIYMVPATLLAMNLVKYLIV